jgi:hypothetical protein
MPDANLSKADASRFSYLVGMGLLYKKDHIDIMIFIIIVTLFVFDFKIKKHRSKSKEFSLLDKSDRQRLFRSPSILLFDS